jgi:hypothetical protein
MPYAEMEPTAAERARGVVSVGTMSTLAVVNLGQSAPITPVASISAPATSPVERTPTMDPVANTNNDLMDAQTYAKLVPGFAEELNALVNRYRAKAKSSGTAGLSAAERSYLAMHGIPEAAGLAAKENEARRKRMGL